jgi:hypothetical protein
MWHLFKYSEFSRPIRDLTTSRAAIISVANEGYARPCTCQEPY